MFALDIDLLLLLVRPDPQYQAYPYRLCVERASGRIVVVYHEDLHAEEEGTPASENSSRREEIRCRPGDFVDLQQANHARRHEWFKAFLAERGQLDEYFKTIGGWLKECATESDRYAWEHREEVQVRAHLREQLVAAGLPVPEQLGA